MKRKMTTRKTQVKEKPMRTKQSRIFLPILILVAILALSITSVILAHNRAETNRTDTGEITHQDDVPRVTVEEAYRAFQDGEVVIVDTRSPAQFQAQHIPGAINMPVDLIDTRKAELDPSAWIITYCT
jgi:hypothetical protein